MKLERKAILLTAIGLLVFSLGCLGSKTAAPTATLPAATATRAANTPLPSATPTVTPTVTPPPAPAVALGDPQRSEEGGYVVPAVPGYQVIPFGGLVSMVAPGADPDTGPVVTVVGGTVAETTNEQLYAQLKSGTPLEISPPEAIAVQGLPGLAADLTGKNNGKAMHGRVALVMVTPTQEFILMVGAPEDRWDDVAPLFDALLAEVEFFAPTAAELPVVESPTATPTPAALDSGIAPGWYVYANGNVVRDVVAYEGVVYAATLGGVVVWDLDGGQPARYTPLDGMGHISTYAVAVCNMPDPRIVVGTQSGLSLFDPATGTWDAAPIAPDDSSVATSKVSRLACDLANQRLLIGYSGLGVLSLADGAWARFTTAEGLSWNGVADILVADQDIWVASGYNGIARIDGDQVTVYNAANGMPDERAYALALAPDGTLWVGGSKGLMKFSAGQWTLYDALSDVNEIRIAPDGAMWVTTAPVVGGRLCRFDPDSGTCPVEYKEPDGLPILALTLDAAGQPIFGTGRGLYRFDGVEAAPLILDTDRLATNFCDALATGVDGMLWVGTDGGIQVLDPAAPAAPWTTYRPQETRGLGGGWANGIAVGPDGTIWASITNGDVSRFRDGKWTSFADLRSLEGVAVDGQGRAWFIDDGEGIVVLNADGSPAFTLTTEDGLLTNDVHALLADGDTVWIGSEDGLARYRDGQVEVVFGKDDPALPNDYIRAIARAPDGALLLGTIMGVVRYDGAQATTLFDFKTYKFSDWLTTLAVAPNGRIWVGTARGLFYSDDAQTWTHLTTADGLPTNFISALHVDQYGAVWVGGGGSNLDGGGLLHIVE